MSTFTIDASQLRKTYGKRAAVRDLTLQVRCGEAFGFLGPNGAGKSTSIKMLLGLGKPSGGSALLLGEPVGTRAVRARVGFLTEHFRFYDWLSADELILFHGRYAGWPRANSVSRSRDCWSESGLVLKAKNPSAVSPRG